MGGLITLNSSIAQDRWLETDSVWGRELAKNSLYALFSAYNSNEIEYKKFYLSLGQTEAKEISSRWLGASSGNLFREIRHPGPEKKWNVMLVAIESMSARFLQHYGSDKNITPNLDQIGRAHV